MSNTIMDTKRKRILEILEIRAIPEDSSLGRSYRASLNALVEAGEATWLNGVYQALPKNLIRLHVGEPDLMTDPVRGAMFLEHFRAVARRLDASASDDDVVYFSVNEGQPFPVHVRTLREMIAREPMVTAIEMSA